MPGIPKVEAISIPTPRENSVLVRVVGRNLENATKVRLRIRRGNENPESPLESERIGRSSSDLMEVWFPGDALRDIIKRHCKRNPRARPAAPGPGEVAGRDQFRGAVPMAEGDDDPAIPG